MTDEIMPKSPLSIREELFCWHYLTDFNGSAAYVRAGYSPKTATVCASLAVQKFKIRHRIHEITQWRIRKLQTAIFDEDLLCAWEQAILPVNPPLSKKELSFVNHYMICFNATKSATSAGYQAKTSRAMEVLASKLLSRPNISACVENRKNEIIRRLSIFQGIALRNAARVAFGDIGRICTSVAREDGGTQLIIRSDATVDDWSAVEQVRYIKGGLKVKMRDKFEPLEFLMQSLGLLDEFGLALKTLQEHGLIVRQGKNGKPEIIDLSKNLVELPMKSPTSQAKNSDSVGAASRREALPPTADRVESEAS
jgi:phage terminase small subunit